MTPEDRQERRDHLRRIYGDVLRLARQDAGFSQKELAAACYLDVKTIQNYEQGRDEPRTEYLARICEALGITGGKS